MLRADPLFAPCMNTHYRKRIPMKSTQNRITLIALLATAQFSISQPVWAADGTNKTSVPNPGALLIVHHACTQTMTNIFADLLKLVGTFPVLDGISNAHIISAEPLLWRNATWEQHRLIYLKNVRTEQLGPGPGGTIPQAAQIQFVEKGGVRLEIHLDQHPVKINRTHECFLPYGTGDNQLRLIYILEENPPDPALEKGVRETIGKHVYVLKKTLQAM